MRNIALIQEGTKVFNGWDCGTEVPGNLYMMCYRGEQEKEKGREKRKAGEQGGKEEGAMTT